MNEFEKNTRKVILEKLKQKLERNLTKEEFNTFSLKRSGIAYEMIINFISNKELSKKEIESYVQKVVEENKKTTHNKV